MARRRRCCCCCGARNCCCICVSPFDRCGRLVVTSTTIVPQSENRSTSNFSGRDNATLNDIKDTNNN